MKKTVRKWFWLWQFEEEEKWLEEMEHQGWHLYSVGWGKYVFEQGEPDRYHYRLQMLEKSPASPESMAYIRFVEETGAEHVASYMRWVYFRKPACEGAFALHSDIDSRVKHLRLVRVFCVPLLLLNTCNLANNLHLGIRNGMAISWFAAALCAAVTAMLTYAIVILSKKISGLQKERQLYE